MCGVSRRQRAGRGERHAAVMHTAGMSTLDRLMRTKQLVHLSVEALTPR